MDKKKLKRGRKATGRSVPIYPRVQIINREWISKVAKFAGCKSENEFIDKMFTTLRRDFTMGDVKALLALRSETYVSKA